MDKKELLARARQEKMKLGKQYEKELHKHYKKVESGDFDNKGLKKLHHIRHEQRRLSDITEWIEEQV